MKKGYELLALALVLAGCSTSREARLPEQLAHRPQAYRDAYVDGCKSAQSKEIQSRDIERTKTDSLYANGWYDGYEECKANYRPPPTRDSGKK